MEDEKAVAEDEAAETSLVTDETEDAPRAVEKQPRRRTIGLLIDPFREPFSAASRRPLSLVPRSAMTIEFENGLPKKHGLYDPAYEKDSCGVGFIAHIKGVRSHSIVRDAAEALRNMDHRGACGCEANTGDGAGILTAIPDELMRREAQAAVQRRTAGDRPLRDRAGLPAARRERARRSAKTTCGNIVERQGQRFIGWRRVPTDAKKADIGKTAAAGEPVIEQMFVAAADSARSHGLLPPAVSDPQAGVSRPEEARRCSERHDVLRGQLQLARSSSTRGSSRRSRSCRIFPTWPTRDYTSHLAMVHSRFSTNTFPSWDRAQPMRFMSHNGEINTLRGNINWMAARQGMLKAELFGDDLKKLFPITEPDCSDSGTFDNVLEFLLHERPHAARIGHDDDPRGVAKPRIDARGQAGVLRISLVPDGAVGRPGVDRVHRRQATSARCSTATACGPAAITSRTTTA